MYRVVLASSCITLRVTSLCWVLSMCYQLSTEKTDSRERAATRHVEALHAEDPHCLLHRNAVEWAQLYAGHVFAGLDKREVNGFMTYTRPEGKSGGHGVGWSEIPKYSFMVPPGWQEIPTSIADLGGTEVQPKACICGSNRPSQPSARQNGPGD